MFVSVDDFVIVCWDVVSCFLFLVKNKIFVVVVML